MPSSTPKKRIYKPGFRPGQTQYGQVTEHQVAWVETHFGRISLMSYPKANENEDGSLFNVGPNVVLELPPGRNKLNLGTLTAEELRLMKELLDLAFELAAPVATERDRIADEAKRNGDDAVYRSYRRAPQLVVREGPLGEHIKGVLFGSDDVSGSDGDADSNSGRDGGAGDGVAAAEPKREEAEDYASQID